jgi:hypothetical protein
MDFPINNKGHYISTARVNITCEESISMLEHNWYMLKGQPRNYRLGNLYKIVYLMRRPGEILYRDDRLIPLYIENVVVAFAEVDVDMKEELMRFKWYLSPDGYAVYYNAILNCNISMHRYVMDFPEGLVVDHLRWNRLDNRRHRMKSCSITENNRNMARHRKIT